MRSSSCDIVFLKGCLPVRFSSCEFVFLWGCLPVRSSSCELVFLQACLPVRLSSSKVVFMQVYHPLKLSSCEFVFMWGRLPVRSSSCNVVFTARLSSIANPPYKGLVRILSLNFKFRYFPGVGGQVKTKLKLHASQQSWSWGCAWQ